MDTLYATDKHKKQRVNLMSSLISKLNQYMAAFCGWLMIGMMLLLVADIIFRGVGKPLQGMAQLSVFVMIIVIYLGLARCEQHREHVNLELLTNLLPSAGRRLFAIIAQLLAVVTITLLLYAVFQNAVDSYTANEAMEGTMELRIWPVKALMVVGLVGFLMQGASHLVELVKGKKKH